MNGTLYLCATPIGNLGDITGRVLQTLNEADMIACEDTRGSLRLLSHFDIHTPMTSYHEFNKYDKAHTIIGMLKEGKNVALITDAGTPVISDPGEVLVRMCREEGINVTSLPGPCACITALSLSGIPGRRFCFEGFLPHDKKERAFVLTELKRESRTIILYEAPHHLKATLSVLYETLGDREIAICRELTKRFEEVKLTTLCEALGFYEENEPRGEYVLVAAGRDPEEAASEERRKYEELTIEEHVKQYEDGGMDHKAAMKQAALDRGIPKREIYNALHKT
ncbi:MAG: 16S rRNA (cytidine(1402)-2'-O)-methyltransferase [Lachnospiraceae bacterium]|nr:16S rRNA (cytidine(1402)-2'-O)-methyltransferase [Lachnospiraceae bacterium]